MASSIKAAEELIQAAISATVDETAFDTLASFQESVAELGFIVDKLHKNTKVDPMHCSMLVKTEEVLETEFKRLRSSVSLNSRLQRLQWGIDHAQIGEFNFLNELGYHANSSGLVVSCLLHFMRGSSCCIKGFDEACFRRGDYSRPVPENSESEAAFAAALCDQIHGLVGERPFVTRRPDEKYYVSMPPC